jgi:hypothetical protein
MVFRSSTFSRVQMRLIRLSVARARLMPPAYVKPYVKRQKNDMAALNADQTWRQLLEKRCDLGDASTADGQPLGRQSTP